jgi:hypothetical protein
MRNHVTTLWNLWPVYLVRFYVRQTWDDLPGPAPVKLALVVVCVAIPGPQDELALIAFTRLCRLWRARREGSR